MDTVDVATAAQRLGVPVATVYKRIQRGRLRVQRTGGHVYVCLDPSMDPSMDPSTPSMDAPSHGHGPLSTPSMDSPRVVDSATLAPLVTTLEATVADLRARLDTSEQANGELRRLLGMALQRPALPAPSEPNPASVAGLPPWWSPRRWWPWGR